jgi:hypothetical protein
MLNTSLHNKSARLGGPFTYEKFLSSLNEAITQQHMPDANTIKVDFMMKKLFLEFLYEFCLEYL